MKRITLRDIVLTIVAIVGLYVGCYIGKKIVTPDFTKYNVLIETVIDTPFGDGYMLGSGVVISEDGIIVTAGHVLQGAKQIRVTLHDGRVFDVNDFYVDNEADVGYVDLPCVTNDFMSLSDSNDLNKHTDIIGVGNPGCILTDIQINGKIKDIHFNRLYLESKDDFILAILDVQPGDSGGGVYVNNKLVGIMIIKIDKFAIMVTSNTCKKVLEKWKNATIEG